MRKTSFVDCCTAQIISRFGQAGGPDRNNVANSRTLENKSYARLKREIMAMRDRLFTTVIITNNQQKNANKALRDLGFAHSTWMGGRLHTDSKIRIWWKEPS